MWINDGQIKDKNGYDIIMKFLLITIMLIGSLIWGVIGVTGYNVVSRTARYLETPILSRIIYTTVGLAAVLFMIQYYNRDTFVPFLDKMAIPTQLLNVSNPMNSNMEVSIIPPKGITHVVYWAAQSETEGAEGMDVKDAYGDYMNAGVAKKDENGRIVMKFMKPISYKIGGKLMAPHVHYRTVISSGMLGKVKTIYL